MIHLLNLRLNCCHQLANQTPIRRALSTVELRKYYTILNVTKNSTAKEIKDSFLKLSKIYHPDNKATGSHLKFVQLKEAYDAVKDGPPTTSGPGSSSSTSAYSPFSAKQSTPNSYQHYDFYSDLRYQSQYNQKRQQAYKMGYNFGGPYANSSTPWEDLKRDQEYRRRQYSNPRARPLVNMTLFFGAIAWIVIYSGVMLIVDVKNHSDTTTTTRKLRDYDDYLTLQEARRRRKEFEARQISYKSTQMSLGKADEPIVSSSIEGTHDNKQTPKNDNIVTTMSISSDSRTLPGKPSHPEA